MSAWVWVLIVIAAIVVLGAVLMGTRGRQRRLEQKRGEAGVLRERSRVRVERAQRQETAAEEQARQANEQKQQAQREREAAESTAQRAEELDPDVK
jgi:hypothetical protein